MTFIQSTGKWAVNLVHEMGLISIFGVNALIRSLTVRFSIQKISEQLYAIGVKCLPVTLLIGFFTGMVLGLQLYLTLAKFNSEGLLGSAISLTLVRELGPVISAIMIVGQAGSSMASEIGIMRNSEQIDALETMDIDPLPFLIGPRLIAAIIAFPILATCFDLVGMIGGHLTGVTLMGLDPGTYWGRIELSIEISDVVGGYIKAITFGYLTTLICCYQGFYTHIHGGFGAKGVSKAATTSVVMSSVTILAADYVITSILL